MLSLVHSSCCILGTDCTGNCFTQISQFFCLFDTLVVVSHFVFLAALAALYLYSHTGQGG